MDNRYFSIPISYIAAILMFQLQVVALAQEAASTSVDLESYIKQDTDRDWAILKWDHNQKTLKGDNQKVFVFNSGQREFTIVTPAQFFCLFCNSDDPNIKISKGGQGIVILDKEVSKLKNELDKKDYPKWSSLGLPRPFTYQQKEGESQVEIDCLLTDEVQYTLKIFNEWVPAEPISICMFYREGQENKKFVFQPGKDSLKIPGTIVLDSIVLNKPAIRQGLRIDAILLDGKSILTKQDSYSWGGTINVPLNGISSSAEGTNTIEVKFTHLDNSLEEQGETIPCVILNTTTVKPDPSPRPHNGTGISAVLFGLSILFSVFMVLFSFIPIKKRASSHIKNTDQAPKSAKENENDVSPENVTQSSDEALRMLYNIIVAEFGKPQGEQRVSEMLQTNIQKLKQTSLIAEQLELSDLPKPDAGVSYKDYFDRIHDKVSKYQVLTNDIIPSIFGVIPPKTPYRSFFQDYVNQANSTTEELTTLKETIKTLLGEPSGDMDAEAQLRQEVTSLQTLPSIINQYFAYAEGTTYDQLFSGVKNRLDSLDTLEKAIEDAFGLPESDHDYLRLFTTNVTNLRNKISEAENEKGEKEKVIKGDYAFFLKRQTDLIKGIKTSYNSCSRYALQGSHFGGYVKEFGKSLLSFAEVVEKMIADKKQESVGAFVDETKHLLIRVISDRTSWINAVCRLHAYSENETIRQHLVQDGIDLRQLDKLYHLTVVFVSNCGISLLPSPPLFTELNDVSEYNSDNKYLPISQLFPDYEDLVKGKDTSIIDIIQIGFIPEGEEPVHTTVAFYSEPQA